MKNPRAKIHPVGVGPGLLAILIFGCAAHDPDGTGANDTPRDIQTALRPGKSSESEIDVATVNKIGSPQLRKKLDIVSALGKPASVEKIANHEHYLFLSYRIRDSNEPLYILFHNEDFLGYAREQGKASLLDIIKDHARIQGDRIVLYRSSSGRRTTYFIAPRERIAGAPQWSKSSKMAPPVSVTQAEQLATDWLKRVEPNSIGEPKARELMEVKNLPGAAFYIVTLWIPGRQTSREVLVLMDGSVIAGEVEGGL